MTDQLDPDQPDPDPFRPDHAWLHVMRGRIILITWFALAANLALVVQDVVERRWIAAVCATLTTLVVVFSLRIFYVLGAAWQASRDPDR